MFSIRQTLNMGIFAKGFPKKVFFWTLDFSFVWIFTDFSRLCNLHAYLVDLIFLCFVKKPIFFRTFSFPITWENRSFRKNKIESWSTKHTRTAQGCKKPKKTQESEESRVQKNTFLGKFSRKCQYTPKNFYIWKSFFGVYLKFAWLKTSKNSTFRIFSRENLTTRSYFRTFWVLWRHFR